EKVGMLAGDRIVTIDDSIVAGKGWSDVKVRSTLRGPKDTKVKLGISRSSSPDLLEFIVTRGDIPVTSIDAAYEIAPGIGYIKVNKFGASTYSEFLTSLMELISAGDAEKLIIDLRSNTGGYMEVAEMMVNEFLEQGMPIVSMKGKNAPDRGPTVADGRGSFKDTDVVVLLDEFSASSSEIFAGAIQDNDRGLIIGRRSFGKGLVQNQLPLSDGSALRLTIARYYTPSGRCIQKTYAPGIDYDRDLFERFERGEQFSRDSIHLNTDNVFATRSGRTVYGGGGIMPDIFVASDTADISSDYLRALNAGLLQKFAFRYVNAHRAELEKASDVSQLMEILPNEWTLAAEFQTFARAHGISINKAYNVNKYRRRLVNNLRALIARDLFGVEGYYEVDNLNDPTVKAAIEALESGQAEAPVKIGL
ncbi:MAG: peptidase S41, partial [Duncaniella sp.]|nr:peptidase S41 [Duncaniella sp.]